MDRLIWGIKDRQHPEDADTERNLRRARRAHPPALLRHLQQDPDRAAGVRARPTRLRDMDFVQAARHKAQGTKI